MAEVLVVSHSAELAGAERSLIALVAACASRGHAVTVWVPTDGPLVDELRGVPGGPADIRIMPNHWWMSRRGGGLVGAVRALQIVLDAVRMGVALRSDRPDVVLVNSSVAPAAMFAAAVWHIPVVTVVRESVRSNPTLRSLLPRDWIIRQISRRSRVVVSVSRFVAAQLGCPSVVVNPPVSAPPTGDVPPGGSRATRGPGLRAVMAGTIGGDKGQLDAVAAVATARARGVPVSLDVFGAGLQRDVAALQADVVRRGLESAVTVHGPVRDMAARWAGYDVSIVTARNEAFGRVTVESLLAGTPVLGYACGGTVELLEAGGGMLVDPRPQALADAMTDVACNPDRLTAMRAEAHRRGEDLRRARNADVLVDLLEREAPD